MGGYNMAMVDEFLDTLTEDYMTLYKENAALKAKLKVLVDKVEEYRATEDSMRATLLTAQKMASQMVQDAEKEKAAMLAQVETDAAQRKAVLEREIAVQNERLRRAKEESATFIANMRRLCNSELEFLDGVPEIQVDPVVPTEQEAAKVEEKVMSIESSVMSSYEVAEDHEHQAAHAAAEAAEAAANAAAVSKADISAAVEAAAVKSAEQVAAQVATEPQAAEGEKTDEVEPEDLAATRRIDFGDLKFGRNYNP
jgi:cell division initiation protein